MPEGTFITEDYCQFMASATIHVYAAVHGGMIFAINAVCLKPDEAKVAGSLAKYMKDRKQPTVHSWRCFKENVDRCHLSVRFKPPGIDVGYLASWAYDLAGEK